LNNQSQLKKPLRLSLKAIFLRIFPQTTTCQSKL
jgi:hypothetical protein